MRRLRQSPPALVLSSALGVVGLVLIVAGIVMGATAISVAGVAAGSLSLGAALYWRSELIRAWGARHPDRRG